MRDRVGCILLVDDSEADNFLHRLVIERSGCADRVEAVLNGQAALAYLCTPRSDGSYPNPELILLDINMPLMNGWEFAEAYAALPSYQFSGTLVVMLTTSINPDDRIRAEEQGIVGDFLTKPLTKNDLKTLIAELPEAQPV